MAPARKSEAKRRGRKASGLRDLPPEAAKLVITAEALKVVRRAVETREAMRRETKMAGGLPTLERLMRDDCAMVRVPVADDGQVELRPVLRAASLEDRLIKLGFEPARAWTGERFAQDVEAMTIGKLTANYEGGPSTGPRSAREPERMLMVMERVTLATAKLNRQERTAAWGVLVFDVSLTDMGWALYGHRLGQSRPRLSDAAWLFLDAALERMQPIYQAIGDGRD